MEPRGVAGGGGGPGCVSGYLYEVQPGANGMNGPNGDGVGVVGGMQVVGGGGAAGAAGMGVNQSTAAVRNQASTKFAQTHNSKFIFIASFVKMSKLISFISFNWFCRF